MQVSPALCLTDRMEKIMLKINNLYANVGEKEILRNINLTVADGETRVFMGPNGAGKSTLGHVLMGNPAYTVKSGSIIFNGEDITDKSADVRARAGMFLSFQEPPEVMGLSLGAFLRSAAEQRRGAVIRLWDFKKELGEAMDLLQMDKSYADRSLNEGFSGGEKKKAEILQLLILKPSLAILDETDSGLDVDAVRLVSEGIREYQKRSGGSLIIVTHSTRILEYLNVDYTHVMVDGSITAEGDGSLVERINRDGYGNI